MKRAILVAVFLLLLALWSLSVRADDLSLKPQHGMLLLNNGEMIEGTITSSGDRYDVTLKDGELHVKRSQVAFVGRDVQACYEHKRGGIDTGRVQDHLELAEWCLRHALLDAARKEIAAAKTADPGHPKIRVLETRLKLTTETPVPVEPIKSGAKASPVEPLDAMVRNLPHGTVENFTNNIQPLLLNSCTKSGCHGSQSPHGLRLERISPNRHAGRKPTQRNLQAALALVDRDQPSESKLLTVPIRPHGAATVAVFTDREQSQYKQLVQWVYQVAGSKQPAPAPPSLAERGAALRQTVPRPGQRLAESTTKAESQADAEPASWSDSFPEQPAGSAAEAASSDKAAKTIGPQGKKPATTNFTPKDPFDPEIFNRRFFGP